jgi:hypothetical protein
MATAAGAHGAEAVSSGGTGHGSATAEGPAPAAEASLPVAAAGPETALSPPSDGDLVAPAVERPSPPGQAPASDDQAAPATATDSPAPPADAVGSAVGAPRAQEPNPNWQAATMVARRPVKAAPPKPRPAPVAAAAATMEVAEATPAAGAAEEAPNGGAAPRAEAVKPAVPKNRIILEQQQTPERELQPGDLICGNCGAGNEASRKFCRRCGASLAEASVLVIPWWRRLLQWRPGQSKTAKPAPTDHAEPEAEAEAEAGKRRKAVKIKRNRNLGKLAKRVLTIAAAIFVVLAVAVPGIRHAVGSTFTRSKNAINKSLSKQVVEVHAVIAVAPSDPTHPSNLLIDANASSYWASPSAPNSGVNTAIDIEFGKDGPTNLDFLVFTIGAQAPDNFANLARPKELLLHFSDNTTWAACSVYCSVQTLQLQDTAKAQKFKVYGKNVQDLTIQIKQIYPGSSQTQLSVAIAEIEFRRYKH